MNLGFDLRQRQLANQYFLLYIVVEPSHFVTSHLPFEIVYLYIHPTTLSRTHLPCSTLYFCGRAITFCSHGINFCLHFCNMTLKYFLFSFPLIFCGLQINVFSATLHCKFFLSFSQKYFVDCKSMFSVLHFCKNLSFCTLLSSI